MRLFVALPLEEELQERLEKLNSELKDFPLRFVPQGNFHITLRFLGECSQERYTPLVEQLQEVAAQTSSFPLSFSQAGYFGSPRAPRVIWMGLKPSAELESLAHKVELAAQKVGFSPESRPFRGHITLARVPKRAKFSAPSLVQKVKALHGDATTFVANSFCLYESYLRPQGPVYIVRETFPLQER